MILITGHKGFIGRNLWNRLSAQGEEIYAFDAVDGDPIELAKNVPWDQINMVYHIGAISNTTELDVLKIQRYNIQSSIEIFEECIKRNIPVYYASSGSVYGNSIANHGTYDHSPLNYYALSKLTVDLWVKENFNRFKSPIVGFRFFNVYGIDEKKSDFCTSPICKFTDQSKADGVIKIFKGSENTYRDFVCVDDVVDIITKEHDTGIYDLGTSNAISFLDVARIISDKFGSTIKFIPFPEVIKGKYQTYTIAQPHFNHNYVSVEEFINSERLSK